MAVATGPELSPESGESRSAAPDVAPTESSEGFGLAEGNRRASASDIDVSQINRTFVPVLARPEAAIEYMFAQLFVRSPELRSLFPLSMIATRTQTAAAISALISGVGQPGGCEESLRELARDVRRYGVGKAQYELFGDALIMTLEQLNGVAWTPEAAAAWKNLVGYFGSVMRAAADADELRQPAWWVGEILQHEERTPTIAVITIRPDQPLRYRAGQFIGVQVPRCPRAWRDYSEANAPRENGLLAIHLRAVHGGMVSNTLVSHCGPGDTVILSAARGSVLASQDEERDLVCVAGGTGFAPIKALIESVIGASGRGRRRNISLYLGARREADFYDSRDLEALALAYPALTVIRVADGTGGTGAALTEAVAIRHPSFRNTDVYLSGPEPMISALRRALASRVPADCLYHDSLDALKAAAGG